MEVSADHYRIPPAEILGKSRKYTVARARHVAVWIARTVCGASYQDLAEGFNRDDHGTATNSCKIVENAVATDPNFQSLLTLLKHRTIAKLEATETATAKTGGAS